MPEQDEIITLLNDLIQINHDRANGFQKAGNALGADHIDIQAAFQKPLSESRNNIPQLAALVGKMGADPDALKTSHGRLYADWMFNALVYEQGDVQTLLKECERGEDAIEKAYKDALATGDLSDEVKEVLSGQQKKIQFSHDLIKAMLI